jgi:hypothetical protein
MPGGCPVDAREMPGGCPGEAQGMPGGCPGDFKIPTSLLTQRRAVIARLAPARPWAPGQGCRARLPGKAAGKGCRTRLPGKATRQGCRARLHAMVQYAESVPYPRAIYYLFDKLVSRSQGARPWGAGQGFLARLPGKAVRQGCMQWYNML